MKQHIKLLSNKDVVKETLRLLKDNPEWKDRYAQYAMAIKKTVKFTEATPENFT